MNTQSIPPVISHVQRDYAWVYQLLTELPQNELAYRAAEAVCFAMGARRSQMTQERFENYIRLILSKRINIGS